MCVLQPCENPTEEGVWWRGDTEWCQYASHHETLIKKGIGNRLKQLNLGTIASAVHPKGARYVLDLQQMEQVAVSSGQRRPVLVIETPAIVPVQQKPVPPQVLPAVRAPAKKLSLHLHYRDSAGNLQRYDSDIENQLLECMASTSQRTLLLRDAKSGYSYFDLEAMEQRFVSHVINGEPTFSSKAAFQIVAEVPWDAAMMASIAAKAEKCLRRKILGMMIDRVKSDDHLDPFLAERACPRKIVSKNCITFSAPLYEKFVDSLEGVLQKFPKDSLGDIMRTVGKEEDRDGPVKIAFKPAKRSTGASIGCNSKAAFWISMAAPVAAAHAVVYGCSVQLKLLAYLVIVPASACGRYAETMRDRCSGYVEVESPEHGLPLAEVTVC